MDFAQINSIVSDWTTRLGLTHWVIKVTTEPPDKPWRNAQIDVSRCYDTATIKLQTGYEKWSREEATQTMIHELLHLHFRDLDESVELNEHLHNDAYDIFKSRYTHETEGIIDRLARVLVENSDTMERNV